MSFLKLELNLRLKKERKNNMNNNWRHEYFEKNINELHANIFRSLEIEQYLKQIFKNNGFNLHECKLNFSNFVMNIFVSVHKTERKTYTLKKNSLLHGENFNLQAKKIVKLKKKLMKKYSLEKESSGNFSNKLKYIKALRFYKQCLLKLKTNRALNLDGLVKKILENLSLFTHNKFSINLTVQEINFINSNSGAKQILLSFRKFERTPFFKEGKSLFIPLITRKNAAQLLGTFIAAQLETIKRHNFFFNFLQESLTLIINQKFSKVKGVKIIIAGRLNNAARSRNKIIKSGKISLLKIDSKINYSESTAFTSNGTLGIKVWICEKKT